MRNVAMAVLSLIQAVAPIGVAIADSAEEAARGAQLHSVADADQTALMILLGLCVIGFQLRRRYRSSEHSWQRIAAADDPVAGGVVRRSELDFAGTGRAVVQQAAANEPCNGKADREGTAGRRMSVASGGARRLSA